MANLECSIAFRNISKKGATFKGANIPSAPLMKRWYNYITHVSPQKGILSAESSICTETVVCCQWAVSYRPHSSGCPWALCKRGQHKTVMHTGSPLAAPWRNCGTFCLHYVRLSWKLQVYRLLSPKQRSIGGDAIIRQLAPPLSYTM